MPEIYRLTAAEMPKHLPALNNILRDAVEHGASVGFVLPLGEQELTDFWQSVKNAVAEESRVLLAAFEGSELVGSAQLALAQQSNGKYRAEVCKVLVLSQYRRQGIAKLLMQEVEHHARDLKRNTLFLDTVLGCPAENLYRSMGYTFVGSIPNYAIDPQGNPEPNAIYCKILQ